MCKVTVKFPNIYQQLNLTAANNYYDVIFMQLHACLDLIRPYFNLTG